MEKLLLVNFSAQGLHIFFKQRRDGFLQQPVAQCLKQDHPDNQEGKDGQQVFMGLIIGIKEKQGAENDQAGGVVDAQQYQDADKQGKPEPEEDGKADPEPSFFHFPVGDKKQSETQVEPVVEHIPEIPLNACQATAFCGLDRSEGELVKEKHQHNGQGIEEGLDQAVDIATMPDKEPEEKEEKYRHCKFQGIGKQGQVDLLINQDEGSRDQHHHRPAAKNFIGGAAKRLVLPRKGQEGEDGGEDAYDVEWRQEGGDMFEVVKVIHHRPEQHQVDEPAEQPGLASHPVFPLPILHPAIGLYSRWPAKSLAALRWYCHRSQPAPVRLRASCGGFPRLQ